MKRSKTIQLGKHFMQGSAAAAAALSVSGCVEPDVTAHPYRTEAECVAAGIYTQDACHTAFVQSQATHLSTAPRFEDRKHCEEEYGVGRCEAAPANTSSVDEETGQTHSGGFMPFMTGYLLGSSTADGNRSYSSPYYSKSSGDYFTGNGSTLSRNAFLTSSGSRSNIQMYSNDFARPAPARFQSRTAVVSRGGFGGGARSYGG